MGNIYGATFKVNRISSDDNEGFRVSTDNHVSIYTQKTSISHETDKIELSAEMVELAGKIDFKDFMKKYKDTGATI